MEVDDARRQALGTFDDHQVARHEVAVHEHLGLVERRVDQELEAAVEHDLVFVGQFDAEVAADEPFPGRGQVRGAAGCRHRAAAWRRWTSVAI